ncbi:MAG: dihydroorotase [Patescibacteria group bacterium]|nr:dihydroorotase [Patescibacteria group bacterium]
MSTLTKEQLESWLETATWENVTKKVADTGHVLLPAMIDTHVHFRVPGDEHKEDWQWGSQAALNGGICGVIDMPNNNPPILDLGVLDQKIEKVKKQKVKGFRSYFYLGVYGGREPDLRCVDKVVGLKLYFGSSTGNLLVNKKDQLEKIYKKWPKLISVHAEDENIIQANRKKYAELNEPIKHSLIRDAKAAESAVKEILNFVRKYKKPTLFCHISTEGEIRLLKNAKNQGLPIYIEVAPHHLFLNEESYSDWGNFVKVNPPLRTKKDNKILWEAIKDGTVDTIASDHAPHTPLEKSLDYKNTPAGLPGVGQILPLMLDAVNKRKLSLKRLIELMHHNPREIFELRDIDGCGVVVDMNQENKIVKEGLDTKCGWSSYEGLTLKGWPEYTILDEKVVNVKRLNPDLNDSQTFYN